MRSFQPRPKSFLLRSFPQPTGHSSSTDPMSLHMGLLTTWMIIGMGLFAGGLIWGLNSHHVSYIAGNKGVYDVFTYSGAVYLQQEQTSNAYVIQESAFQPPIDGVIENSLLASAPITYSSDGFNFVASTDTMLVLISGRSSKLNDWVHPIVKFTFQGITYISDAYTTSPHGYMVNHWPYALPLLLLGIVCTGFLILFVTHAKKQQKQAAAEARAALEALPSPFARELGEEQDQQS